MKNKKLLIIIAIVIFLILLCIASVLAVMLFMQKPKTNTNNETTPTPSNSVSVTTSDTILPSVTAAITSGVSGTPTPPSGWDPIQNTKYGYTMYRPHSWYFRIFDGQEMIGIAPTAIPVASDYGGEVVVFKIPNPSSEIASLKASLTPGYTDTTRVINGVNWEMIVGVQPGGGVFDDKYVKYGIFTHGSNTYWVALANSAADYGGHADEFETVITTIWFN